MMQEPKARQPLKPREALNLAEEKVGSYCEDIHLEDRGNLVIRVDTPKLAVLIRALRDDDELSYRYLVYVTAADYEDHMEGLYLLRSVAHGVPVEIRTDIDRDDPHVPSLALLYSTACWHERETYDLLGIIYDGHPELTRILTRREEEVYPLRKDAEPRREVRDEWHYKNLEDALRLPGSRDRRERS